MGDYSFIDAYLKGEEASILSAPQMDMLARVPDISEALEIIRSTDIGAYIGSNPFQNFDELDAVLWRYFGDIIGRIRWLQLTPEAVRTLLDAYEVKYDVANIKAALRHVITGTAVKMLPLGKIQKSGLLDELASAADINTINAILYRSRLHTFAAAMTGCKEDASGRQRLVQENRLDEQYYSDLLDSVKKLPDSEIMTQVVGIAIDIGNLKLVLRALASGIAGEAAEYVLSGGYLISGTVARQLLGTEVAVLPSRVPYLYQDILKEAVDSYAKTADITVIEGIIDRHSLRILGGRLATRLSSPAVALWYLILKENEVRNMRLILKSIYDGRLPETVKSSLVAAA